MEQLFFKAENFISGKATHTVMNVRPLISMLEKDSYAHWIFGGDSSSLIDNVNNRKLNLQSGATVQPFYSQNSVTISASAGNALLSDISDTSEQSVTLCAVVKTSSASLGILLGNLVPSNSTTSSGLSAFVSANKAYLTVKPVFSESPAVGGIASLDSSATINQLNTFFIACSVDKQTKNGIIYVCQNDIEASNKAIYTSNYSTPINKIGIGNVAYAPASTSGSLIFNEAIIYNKALTVDQIKLVAKRSRNRMKDQGIEF